MPLDWPTVSMTLHLNQRGPKARNKLQLSPGHHTQHSSHLSGRAILPNPGDCECFLYPCMHGFQQIATPVFTRHPMIPFLSMPVEVFKHWDPAGVEGCIEIPGTATMQVECTVLHYKKVVKINRPCGKHTGAGLLIQSAWFLPKQMQSGNFLKQPN